MNAGERIRSARKAMGLTQESLGKASGVSKGAVSQWESGETKTLKGPHLIACARALGVTEDWILNGGGHAPRPASIQGSLAIGNEPSGKMEAHIGASLPQDIEVLVTTYGMLSETRQAAARQALEALLDEQLEELEEMKKGSRDARPTTAQKDGARAPARTEEPP